MARLARLGLSVVGEPSTLSGVACGNVNLQRGVELERGLSSMAEDNYVARVDVATIDTVHAPAVGQTLVHPEGSFVLDRLLADNGATRQFIVVAA